MDTQVLFQDMTKVPLPMLASAVANLTLRLRRVDRAELADFYLDGEFDYDTAYQAILATAQASDEVYLMVVQGEPAAMCGIARAADGSDRRDVWLMGTPSIYDARHGFLRESRVMLQKWASQDDSPMGAPVDARHVESLEWLRWLGFEDGEHIPHPTNPDLYQVVMTYAVSPSSRAGRSGSGDAGRIDSRPDTGGTSRRARDPRPAGRPR